MGVYFFDLLDGDGRCEDEEGMEFSSLASVHRHAIRCIRDLLSAAVARAQLSLDGRIEVRDAAGNLVLTVPFSEAVTVAA